MTDRKTIDLGQVESGAAANETLFSSIRDNDLNHEERIQDLEAGGAPKGVLSGQTVSGDILFNFIRPDNVTNECDVLTSTVDFTVSNGITTRTYSDVSDYSVTGLYQAPASNNTCVVDNILIDTDKYAGTDTSVITVNSMGSEIQSLIGTYAAFKHGTEVFYARVKSTTELELAFRGHYFDNLGDKIAREGISTTDVITLLKINYLFAHYDQDLIIIGKNVYEQTIEPTSPISGDFWTVPNSNEWKQYNGASWSTKNIVPIGQAICESVACTASRSIDKDLTFEPTLNFKFQVKDATTIESESTAGDISVYGSTFSFSGAKIEGDITTDLESPYIEAVDTLYYIYMLQDGSIKLSPIRPFYSAELFGWYHPYKSWRCVNAVYNDPAGDLIDYIELEDYSYPVTYNYEGIGSFTFVRGGSNYFNEVTCIGAGGYGWRRTDGNYYGGHSGAGVWIKSLVRETTLSARAGQRPLQGTQLTSFFGDYCFANYGQNSFSSSTAADFQTETGTIDGVIYDNDGQLGLLTTDGIGADRSEFKDFPLAAGGIIGSIGTSPGAGSGAGSASGATVIGSKGAIKIVSKLIQGE